MPQPNWCGCLPHPCRAKLHPLRRARATSEREEIESLGGPLPQDGEVFFYGSRNIRRCQSRQPRMGEKTLVVIWQRRPAHGPARASWGAARAAKGWRGSSGARIALPNRPGPSGYAPQAQTRGGVDARASRPTKIETAALAASRKLEAEDERAPMWALPASRRRRLRRPVGGAQWWWWWWWWWWWASKQV